MLTVCVYVCVCVLNAMLVLGSGNAGVKNINLHVSGRRLINNVFAYFYLGILSCFASFSHSVSFADVMRALDCDVCVCVCVCRVSF